ncbi:unnamed protein product [Protopolystoma xenopodis]|uniref:C2H2-type domain-containing protein n=1 Tax=Protopolystoma xenopodis TaxID=117903 RepID=A0A448X2K3_9PLAT|nr:unnamed protein product [Protopolystoma xenopodis]
MNFKELAEHRKWNKEKKSGHPLCDFCDSRFYEYEDLVEHVHSIHFTCEVCHGAGQLEVFRDRDELNRHYTTYHFTCQECQDAGTMVVFSTLNQLGMHRLQEHPNSVAGGPHSWLDFKMAPLSESVRGVASRRNPRISGGRIYGGNLKAQILFIIVLF